MKSKVWTTAMENFDTGDLDQLLFTNGKAFLISETGNVITLLEVTVDQRDFEPDNDRLWRDIVIDDTFEDIR